MASLIEKEALGSSKTPLVAAWFYVFAPLIDYVVALIDDVSETSISYDPDSSEIVADDGSLVAKIKLILGGNVNVSLKGRALYEFTGGKREAFMESADNPRKLRDKLIRKLGYPANAADPTDIGRLQHRLVKNVTSQFQKHARVLESFEFATGQVYYDFGGSDTQVGYALEWERVANIQRLRKFGIDPKTRVYERLHHRYKTDGSGRADLRVVGELPNGWTYTIVGLTRTTATVKDVVRKLDDFIVIKDEEGNPVYE